MSAFVHRVREAERFGVDPLTGLVSRQGLREAMATMLAANADASIDAGPSLLVLDLDRFKTVNDSAGHRTGDGILCRVAKRIVTAVGDGAVVARVSGDEFAVLLPPDRDPTAIAARLLDIIGRPYLVDGHAVTLSVSIGLARSPGAGVDADSLTRAANIALHQAEVAGRNRVTTFSQPMGDQAVRRQALENDLRTALAYEQVHLRKAMALEQFELHYQPQVDLEDGRVVGFEALVRWRHPERGLVPPNDFIPLAEETGLIGLLGKWVMRTACRTAAMWPAPPSGAPLRIAVNVSPLQLKEGPSLVRSIADALDQSGLAAERLDVEITETALVGEAGAVLAAIRDLGPRLSLDDFGTGFSSLSQLSRFPFGQLKIDRSFVSPLGGGDLQLRPGVFQREPAWMLRSIAALGEGLGLSTIAEGVETIEQARIVRRAGVHEMQGFLVSKAVRDTEVGPLLQSLATAPWRKELTRE